MDMHGIMSREPCAPGGGMVAELVGFCDGELESERAAAFREHLQICEVCRTHLVEVMQLTARLSELATWRRGDPPT